MTEKSAIAEEEVRREVKRALAACEGDKDAALLLLAVTIVIARRGISAGYLRLGDRR